MNKKIQGDEIEYIAYKGPLFTIEWYHNEKNNSEVLEYYKALELEQRAQIMGLFKRFCEQGSIKNKEKFRNEGEQIFAFKVDQERYLCFFVKGKKIIVTNAFRKKSQKLPIAERDKASQRRESYFQRCLKGDYYD